MISNFSAHPKPQNNNAKIACLVMTAVSALGFIIYFMMDSYRGFVGIFALLCLTTAILIYTKFISPEFYYDIISEDVEEPLFVVRQVVGKRSSALCRIALADIVSVEGEDKRAMREHKTDKDTRKYVYAPTLFPSYIYRITLRSRYERAEIIIECSEEFAGMLLAARDEAKAMRIAEES